MISRSEDIIEEISVQVLPMGGSWTTSHRVSSPMSDFPAYASSRESWFGRLSGAFICVSLADGTQGYGLCGSTHGEAQACLLVSQLRDLVMGQSCLHPSAVSDMLRRATQHYGRDGLVSGLISGIDVAMWDAVAKLQGKPVSELLAPAPTGSREMAYYTTTYSPEGMTGRGNRDLKLAMPCGPADGEPGKAVNEELIARARGIVGPDAILAIDCYMSWSIDYTLDMARRCHDYRLSWIEEPLEPDDLTGYRRLTDELTPLGVAVAAGEHSFTLRQFQELVTVAGLPIIQPDIHRAGGPTVLMRIAELARENNVQLMCHGGGLPTLHTLLAIGPDVAPRCEFLGILVEDDWPLKGEPSPKDDVIAVPASAGFGYTWLPSVPLEEPIPVYG